jgi:hypothetical protein
VISNFRWFWLIEFLAQILYGIAFKLMPRRLWTGLVSPPGRIIGAQIVAAAVISIKQDREAIIFAKLISAASPLQPCSGRQGASE